MKYLTAAAMGLALVLSACGNQPDQSNTVLKTAGSQLASIAKGGGARRKGKAPYAQVTQKQLENTKVPALQVNNETRGGSDILRLATRRNDSNPGRVAVWGGGGALQLFVRGGVLVGTRGIGGDIISADATSTIRAIAGARSGNGERRYFISDGAYGQVELVLSCDIETVGRSTTQVVHLSYATTHLRETCIGGANDNVRIVNEYWVQPSSGIVRRSRQWAGPLSGYFELILLRN